MGSFNLQIRLKYVQNKTCFLKLVLSCSMARYVAPSRYTVVYGDWSALVVYFWIALFTFHQFYYVKQ